MAKRRSVAHAKAVREIEAGLRSLSRGLRLLARGVAPASAEGRSASPRRVTPALRLQGRYMGLIRTLPIRKKSRVMALRASKGVHEAIRLARELRA